MTATILDGKKIYEEAIPELAKRVASFSHPLTLAIIQVGNKADSTSYINSKKRFAEKIGVKVNHIQVSESVGQKELIDIVGKNNSDQAVDGIIIQLPLPIALDSDAILDAVLPSKDVDALSAHNVKRWLDGNEDIVLPATARGVRSLLKYYKIDLFGKKVTVVGRSTLVGKPIITMCLNENATVTVCHSKTVDLAKDTQRADVLIVAAGKPNLITKDLVRAGQVVIDVGINSVVASQISGISDKLDEEIPNRKIVGDVDFASVSEIVSAISPVPGGVGLMTVVSLFENLLDLAR